MQTNQESDAATRLDEAVARLGISSEFAVLPQSLAEVLRTAPDHEGAFDTYLGFLQREQGFAARVLSLANSPALGTRLPMRDLGSALIWLGTLGTRNAILSVAVMDASRGQSRLLLQSVACAVFAARLGNLLAVQEANDFFVAGLLHNVGKILLINAGVQGLDEPLARMAEGSLTLEQEREAFGCTHCEVGAWFAQRWRLPRDHVEALLHYPNPPADATLMTQVVARGSQWTRNFTLSAYELPADTERILAYFQQAHSLPRQEILNAIQDIGDDVDALTAHLRTDPPTMADTLRILQQANIALGEINAQAEILRVRAEEQMRHLRLVQELAATSSAHGSVQAICQHAVTLISKRMGLGVVSLMIPNDAGALFVIAGVGIPRGLIAQPDAVTGAPLAQRVFDECAPVLIKDFTGQPDISPSEHAKRYTTPSALSVPIVHAARALGVLNLNNKRDGTSFHERDAQLFETIGHHLGSLLHAEEQRTRHEQSEGRFQALAAATPAALVGFDDTGRVWLWNTGATTVTGIAEADAVGKPIARLLLPENETNAAQRWLDTIRANQSVVGEQGFFRDQQGNLACVLHTVVPLEDGRVGVWMGVDITGEKNARLDSQKRAIEIAAMNRVMTRILGELDRERMLAIFMEETRRAAAVEKGALIALVNGLPAAIVVTQGFGEPAPDDGLLAWTAENLTEAVSIASDSPTANAPEAKAFLEREAIRDTAIVRLPIPSERGFVLAAFNSPDTTAAHDAIRVLEDMATVAAIGLRIADDLAARMRYEQLRVAASMAVTYNHEVNNALQVIRAAVDLANRAGKGIEGEDLQGVERAIHVIHKLNEALGSQYVPTFTRYADGSDMLDPHQPQAEPPAAKRHGEPA